MTMIGELNLHNSYLKNNMGTFLSHISHELRSPICSVALAIDLLKNRKDFNIKEQELDHLLDLMTKNCNESLALIDDLVTSSRKGENDFLIEKESLINIQNIIGDVIEENEFRFKDSNINILFQFFKFC